MTLQRLDHFVLTVQDIATTCEFYTRALGMEVVTFGAGRTALRFGQQKINLHEVGKEYKPNAARPTPGSGDLCFLSDRPLAEWINHLRARRHHRGRPGEEDGRARPHRVHLRA